MDSVIASVGRDGTSAPVHAVEIRRMTKRPKVHENVTVSKTRRKHGPLSIPFRIFSLFSMSCFAQRIAVDTVSDDNQNGLLGRQSPGDTDKKCLILDLDETLVHSSFKPIHNPDYIIPVEIDGTIHQVYVRKRPGVDDFLLNCAQHYEVVIFTASLAKYADPLLDLLDVHRVVRRRLYRDACVMHGGRYVKDLSVLGRDLSSTIIIDNSPNSYALHRTNAIPCVSWFEDKFDTELFDLLPFLYMLTTVDDVRTALTYPEAPDLEAP